MAVLVASFGQAGWLCGRARWRQLAGVSRFAPL